LAKLGPTNANSSPVAIRFVFSAEAKARLKPYLLPGGMTIRSNFLCNRGYGDASKLHPRGPRLSFKDVCRVL
jgi:hypothetical protein